MFFSYCLCYYYYLSKTAYCTVTLGWDLCNIFIVFVAKKFIFCMLSHFGALVGYFLLLDSGFINMRVVTWGSSPGGRLQSWWKQSSLVLHISPTGSRESETYQDNNKRGFFQRYKVGLQIFSSCNSNISYMFNTCRQIRTIMLNYM